MDAGDMFVPSAPSRRMAPAQRDHAPIRASLGVAGLADAPPTLGAAGRAPEAEPRPNHHRLPV